jgi:hypothetical protein
MTDTLMDPTDPRYLAAVRAAYDAAAPQRAAEAAARAAARKARTPAQRKADYVERQVEHAIEEANDGPTSYFATYMEPGDYTAYGARVADDALVQADLDWDGAAAIWNATPGTEDGDEKYVAVQNAYGDELADEMISMAEELGEVQ